MSPYVFYRVLKTCPTDISLPQEQTFRNQCSTSCADIKVYSRPNTRSSHKTLPSATRWRSSLRQFSHALRSKFNVRKAANLIRFNNSEDRTYKEGTNFQNRNLAFRGTTRLFGNSSVIYSFNYCRHLSKLNFNLRPIINNETPPTVLITPFCWYISKFFFLRLSEL